jgi:glycosyltransferase involved in cell wall biosynthesis
MHVRRTKARGLPVFFALQQHGRLVIHSSKGAAREIVEGGVDGLALDPENISRLADRLNHLLSRPSWALAIGESGRRKVETNYLDPALR